MKARFTALILATTVIAAADAQLNPIANFCRRVFHQSTISNKTLYITGGLATLTPTPSSPKSNPITISAGSFLSLPLSTTWDWRQNLTITALPGSPPPVSHGALFTGPSDTLYAFGGTTDLDLDSAALRPDASVWSYDTASESSSVSALRGAQLAGVAAGASVSVPEKGLAFWIGGEVEDTEVEGMVVFEWVGVEGMVGNVSTAEMGGRVSGEMVYVGGVGGEGVLVLVGGRRGEVLVDMSEVWVFDVGVVGSGSMNGGPGWYRQVAVGQVPEGRVDFCVVVVAARDGSSNNIYMYGGRDDAGKVYDDVYVLSLPSFEWIQIYTGDSPRYGHTCHFVAPRQMITVGGATTANITANCDWERRGVAVYDLSTIQWGSVFDADAAEYEVPKRISDVIGGGGAGGATSLQPSWGFDDEALRDLFLRKTETEVPTATPTPAGVPETQDILESDGSVGAIVGGVVGGIAALAVAAVGMWILVKRWVNRGVEIHIPREMVSVESMGVLKEERWKGLYGEMEETGTWETPVRRERGW